MPKANVVTKPARLASKEASRLPSTKVGTFVSRNKSLIRLATTLINKEVERLNNRVDSLYAAEQKVAVAEESQMSERSAAHSGKQQTILESAITQPARGARPPLTAWPNRRLADLFRRYNRRFFNGRLREWIVTSTGKFHGHYGQADLRHKVLFVQIPAHSTDEGVRATLIHEMAHAATNGAHGRLWRTEMQRLHVAGAPTEPLDFLVPYSARDIVTSFIDAAAEGAAWEEAWAFLGRGWEDPHGEPRMNRAIENQCKSFFGRERQRIERLQRAARPQAAFGANTSPSERRGAA
jgi:hypothetical protein